MIDFKERKKEVIMKYLFHRINFNIYGKSGVYTFARSDIAFSFINFLLHDPLVSSFKYSRFNTSEVNYTHRSSIETKQKYGTKQFKEILSFAKKWKWLE